VSRRELFGSLCAMVFLVNLARVVFAPLVQPVAADFGVTAASLGIVTSAAWMGSAAPRLPTGYLLTRVPRRYVVGATGMLLVVTAAFTAFAQSVTHLTIGAFLMGLSSGMYFIAANPLVSELFPESVGRAIGIHGMASQLAAVTAPLAVSAILLVGDWRTTFLCIAGVAAAATAFLVWAARRTDLPEAGGEDRSLLAAARAQWPIILTGIAFIGAAGFLWNGVFNLYGDYLETVKGIDPATGRAMLSMMFAAGVPAFLVTGQLADRFPNVPLLLSIVGGFVVCVVALTLAEGLIAVGAVSLLLGYVIHSLFPAVDTYMLASLPDKHRASAYALYSSTMMFVQALGSGSVGTAVARGVSYTVVFQGLAAAVGGVVVVMFVLYRAGRLPAGGRPESRASEPAA
jgi:DHA1 family inner membrane transport protein